MTQMGKIGVTVPFNPFSNRVALLLTSSGEGARLYPPHVFARRLLLPAHDGLVVLIAKQGFESFPVVGSEGNALGGGFPAL